MLLAYCDASIKDSKAVATSFITTEDTYVTCFTKTYEDVRSSTHAELLGVLQTIKYISDELEDKRVTIYSDNLSIVSQCINVLSTWEVPEDVVERDLYLELLAHCKNMCVSLKHVRGHQHMHNPNKICDILSKVYFYLES